MRNLRHNPLIALVTNAVFHISAGTLIAVGLVAIIHQPAIPYLIQPAKITFATLIISGLILLLTLQLHYTIGSKLQNHLLSFSESYLARFKKHPRSSSAEIAIAGTFIFLFIGIGLFKLSTPVLMTLWLLSLLASVIAYSKAINSN